jgi:hypothetical protein
MGLYTALVDVCEVGHYGERPLSGTRKIRVASATTRLQDRQRVTKATHPTNHV